MPKGDRYILKADPEDGTTPISNLLLEAVAMAKLSGLQKGAILFLWRQTYGWHVQGKRLKERRIPLSKWRDALNSSSPRVSTALKDLTDKKIILRHQFEGWQGYSYSINTNISEWNSNCIDLELLSKTITVTENVTVTKGATVTENEKGTVTENVMEQLPKTITPSDTDLAMPKESLNKIKESIGGEQSFEEYFYELKQRFPDLDFDAEFERFNLYWAEDGRSLKRPKLALLNWMTKAQKWQGKDQHRESARAELEREQEQKGEWPTCI